MLNAVLSRFSPVQLFATPWTVAHQALLSMEFSRQEYWREWQCLSPADLLDPGIEPAPLMSPVLAGGFFTIAPPGKPLINNFTYVFFSPGFVFITKCY